MKRADFKPRIQWEFDGKPYSLSLNLSRLQLRKAKKQGHFGGIPVVVENGSKKRR